MKPQTLPTNERQYHPEKIRKAPTMHCVTGQTGHYGGLLTDWPVLVSAGVAYNNPGNGFSIHVPETDDLIVDSGGFQAATK